MERIRSLREHEEAAINYGFSKEKTVDVFKKDLKRLTSFVIFYGISIALYTEMNFFNVYENFSAFVLMHAIASVFGMFYLIKQSEYETALKHGFKLSTNAKKVIETKHRLVGDTFEQIFVCLPAIYAVSLFFGLELPFHLVALVFLVFAINFVVGMVIIKSFGKKNEKARQIKPIKESTFFSLHIAEINELIERRNELQEEEAYRDFLIRQSKRLNEIINLFENSDTATQIDTHKQVVQVFELIKRQMTIEEKEEV